MNFNENEERIRYFKERLKSGINVKQKINNSLSVYMDRTMHVVQEMVHAGFGKIPISSYNYKIFFTIKQRFYKDKITYMGSFCNMEKQSEDSVHVIYLIKSKKKNEALPENGSPPCQKEENILKYI